MSGVPAGADGSRQRVLVVGIGSPDRGDDAVGPSVARAVAARGLHGVEVVEHEDPTALLDLWTGHDLVIVVDAVRSGSPAGTLHELETGACADVTRLPPGDPPRHGGTHAVGVLTVVELARALGRLPPRLVVLGIEATGFEHGAPLSAPVSAAVPRAVDRAVAVLGRVSPAT